MKRNVFTFLVLMGMAVTASAQTEEGNWMVGGNLDLNTVKNNTTIGFSPMAGYFFANNFAAGAMVNLNYSKQNNAKNTNWGFGPFARYYFGTMNVRPLIHAQWNYLSSKTSTTTIVNSTTYTSTNTYNGSELYLAGGLAAFINRNVAIEGLAGYDYTKFRHAGDGSGGLKMKIGFQVYLGGDQVDRVRRKRG